MFTWPNAVYELFSKDNCAATTSCPIWGRRYDKDAGVSVPHSTPTITIQGSAAEPVLLSHNPMWNRTRQFAQATFFPRTGTNASQPTTMAQQNQIAQPEEAAIGKDKKLNEPLFGPSIGSVSGGPAWTLSNEKKVLKDELTPDIVSSWIEKSKEVSSLGE